MKVDFLIIGAMKCGTTTLSQMLSAHPQISFSKIKEPQFFSSCPEWKQELPKYHALFSKRPGSLCGEASTNYSKIPAYNLGIWKDIHEYNPHMRIIYIMRHPIQRIISHYMHIFQRGFISTNIQEALRQNAGLIDTSRYYTQIKPFIDTFGKDQVLLLKFEDLKIDQKKILKSLATFLEIDESKFLDLPEISANKSLGSFKVPKKLDFIFRHKKKIRSFIPGSLYSFTKSLFVRFNKRGFQERPTLSPLEQTVLLHMLDSEIQGVEKITRWNLDDWRLPIPNKNLIK